MRVVGAISPDLQKSVDGAICPRLDQRVVRALYSIMVAVIVLIALPVSQLRTVSVFVECCCPDPTRCHCPEPGKPVPGQPTMSDCHKSGQIIAISAAAELQAPPLQVVPSPPRRALTVVFPVRLPHEPPSPARPPAPS